MMKNALAKAVIAAMGTLAATSAVHAASYVVTTHGSTMSQQEEAAIVAAGGTITARLPQIGVAVVESNDPGFAARAAAVSGVRSAVADITLQYEVPAPREEISEDFANPPTSGDNDRFFDLQWGHAAVDAAGAWNRGYRGAGVRVAVLDSGVFCAHADIAPNLIAAESTSFVAGESYCNTLSSQSSHGTHVAGTIIAADNGIGTIGIAPEAKMFAVKVLSATTGSGSFAGIIQGIVYAADHGADVINMSLGVRGGLPKGDGQGANDVAELINATKRAVQYARDQNATVVASAGNDGRDLDHDANVISFPGQVPGVITVSATAPVGWAKAPTTTFLDNRASYTNYGQSAIHFSAPGGDFSYPGNEACVVRGVSQSCWVFDMVFSTTRTGFYGWNAGTSMAAPHVSGVVALIVGKNGGEMSPSAVERELRAAADDLGKPGNDDTYGDGRVNAANAVD